MLKPGDRGEVCRVINTIQNYRLEHNVTPQFAVRAKTD
jgi:hypothetical protein